MKSFLIALASFAVLDGLWLGVVMRDFYRVQLAPIARLGAEGALAPIWSVALPVYVLLALAIAVFVQPRVGQGSVLAAAGFGALMGLLLYGVYDLTNWATLKDYGARIALVDLAWGTFACATTAAIVRWAK